MSTTGYVAELELLDGSAVPRGTPCRVARVLPARAGGLDRVSVHLRGLGDRLWTRAVLRQTAPAVLVRQAVSQMLGGDPNAAPGQRIVRGAGHSRVVKVTLRLEAAQAASQAGRARDADVRRGTTSRRCWAA
jgi:hypothetical protein